MNIANYFIVSTTDQIPENQRIRLTEHAREKGRDIRICIEGEGTRRTRPVKAEILYKLPHRICNDALDYKLNRWAKSSIELILDINELVKKGIAFIRYVENLHFPRQPDGCMSKSYQPLLDLSGSFFRNDDGGHSQSQD